jgi:hypothetical protein
MKTEELKMHILQISASRSTCHQEIEDQDHLKLSNFQPLALARDYHPSQHSALKKKKRFISVKFNYS